LLSSDKTIAVIDGSGVLADPVGINKEELVRLAKLRVPVSHFDRSKLSPEGYLVKIEDQDVKLPCESFCDSFFVFLSHGWICWVAGEIIPDGTDFRNGAHFRFKADLFVPCGGRWVLCVCVPLVVLLTIGCFAQTGGGEHFECCCHD
jgi:glutamate dehydrogenase